MFYRTTMCSHYWHHSLRHTRHVLLHMYRPLICLIYFSNCVTNLPVISYQTICSHYWHHSLHHTRHALLHGWSSSLSPGLLCPDTDRRWISWWRQSFLYYWDLVERKNKAISLRKSFLFLKILNIPVPVMFMYILECISHGDSKYVMWSSKMSRNSLKYWFLDRANNNIQFPLYLYVLNITKMAISLEPYVQFW